MGSLVRYAICQRKVKRCASRKEELELGGDQWGGSHLPRLQGFSLECEGGEDVEKGRKGFKRKGGGSFRKFNRPEQSPPRMIHFGIREHSACVIRTGTGF